MHSVVQEFPTEPESCAGGVILVSGSVGGRLASTVMNDGNPATVSAMQEFSSNCLARMNTHGVPTGAAMAPS